MMHLVTPRCISESPKLLSQKGEQKSKNPCNAHLEWWIPVIPITSLFPRGEEDGTHAWDIRCYDDRFATPSKADVKNPGTSASLPSKVTPAGLSELLRRKNPTALINQPASNSDLATSGGTSAYQKFGVRSYDSASTWVPQNSFRFDAPTFEGFEALRLIEVEGRWFGWWGRTFLYFGTMESRNLAPSQTTDHL